MTAAKNVCHHYGVNPLIVFDISSFFREVTLLSPHNFSALLEGETLEIPMESQKKPYLTVVPGRNTIFISHLLAVAQATQSHLIHLAVHRGDHAVYPDCRPVYLEHMNHAIIEASDAKVTLQTPFRDFSKADIIRIGKDLKVPFGMTWTCYKGGILPCGVCDACVGRLNAFREAGVASTEEPIRSESIQG
jgi:7-cyano-7-deazaguanine synthase